MGLTQALRRRLTAGEGGDMKVTKIGWVGKTYLSKDLLFKTEQGGVDYWDSVIQTTKGREVHWDDNDWPPRKVRITVEDVK